MAKRYTYSRSILADDQGNQEVFTAVEFDSFDEAIAAVERGIYDRRLTLKKKAPDTLRNDRVNVPGTTGGTLPVGGTTTDGK
jgi:hypothetical protein